MALLIDTSVFIALERRRLALSRLFASAPDETFALPAITVAELLIGAHRADTPQRRSARLNFVNGIEERFDVLPFGQEVARQYAQVAAQLLNNGAMIGLHDLMIAATALSHSYIVLTNNIRDFGRVPGLAVRQPAI